MGTVLPPSEPAVIPSSQSQFSPADVVPKSGWSQAATIRYAIACEDEGSVLSNVRDRESWDALAKLLSLLTKDSDTFPHSSEILRQWNSSPKHQASAKEAYAWRAALEEIKDSDLKKKCEKVVKSKEELVLMTDKPAMLKIAGEITNALLHSYNASHKITFCEKP